MNFYDVAVHGDTVKFADGRTMKLIDSVMSKLSGKQGELKLWEMKTICISISVELSQLQEFPNMK